MKEGLLGPLLRLAKLWRRTRPLCRRDVTRCGLRPLDKPSRRRRTMRAAIANRLRRAGRALRITRRARKRCTTKLRGPARPCMLFVQT